MARIYTESTITDKKVVSPDDFNLENSNLREATNGNLDGHNIPAGSIDRLVLSERTLDDQGVLRISRGVWFDYFTLRVESGSVSTPLETVSLKNGGVSGAWQNLSKFPFSISDIEQTITLTTDGILIGSYHIDWERRWGFDTANTNLIPQNYYDWVNLGFFINGLLIKESGKLYPRRDTSIIPFFIELPAGEYTTSFKIQTSREPPRAGADTSQDAADISIYQVGFDIKQFKR
jgi:hypothetical protein